MNRRRLLTLLAAGAAVASGAACAEPNASSPELASDVKRGLAFLREEEKLARDVYLALAEQDPIFGNIAQSEQRHMDAMLGLLDAYGLPDPAEDRPQGSFANAELQSLYDVLVVKGKQSHVAALEVGVEIEEKDLVDLADLDDSASASDVDRVLASLAKGSRNHLRTYHAALVAAGGSWEAKHLSQEVFDAVVASEMERGSMSARRGRGP